MKLSVHPYFLEFIRPFALAHGTRVGTQLAFVKIEAQGICAYGEASLPPYLPETFESVKRWVEGQTSELDSLLQNNLFQNKERIPFCKSNPAASAALQSAVLHWHALFHGKSLGSFFPQDDNQPSLTLTLTKNDYVDIHEKLECAQDFSHLKLKLTGQSDDLDFVKAIRSHTDLPFCLDANQGYQQKEAAIKLIEAVAPLGCILVEQPLLAQDHDGHYWLKQRLPIPIVADESIRTVGDLKQYHTAYSGVNIKLMKCGGLFQAQQMLDFSGGEGFLKLLGCMTESSLGVGTAAALASQCPIADLDAPYLIKNDPFEGFKIVNNQIEMAEHIGLRSSIRL